MIASAPAAPLAPWLGGKKYLAARIIARIAQIPHHCYAEPFVGMGGVFLRKPPSPVEVINDRAGDVVNLFRIVREHPDELARQFDVAVAARSVFQRLVATPPDTLTDVQRAARFAYLQRLSFGGKPVNAGRHGSNLHVDRRASFSAARMGRLIGLAHRRLDGVTIEGLDWGDFLRRYDRPTTLFYLDPPYWGHETDYGADLFARDDFERLAARLQALRGRFLLSLNDQPDVRELFAWARIDTVETRYSVNPRANRRVTELLNQLLTLPFMPRAIA